MLEINKIYTASKISYLMGKGIKRYQKFIKLEDYERMETGMIIKFENIINKFDTIRMSNLCAKDLRKELRNVRN